MAKASTSAASKRPHPHRKRMTWQKWVMLMLAAATALMLIFDAYLFQGIYIAPNRITSRYIQIEDEKIPSALDQVSVVFLSDIEYGEGFTKEKGNELFGQIAAIDPDILLIGGDLFAWDQPIDESLRNQMTQWISSIKAPLGKFAVYGEQDLVDSDHQISVNDIYAHAQVEILNNSSVLLSNHSADGIRLVGLAPDADPSAAAASVGEGQYTLLLSHYPDNMLTLEGSSLSADYALCGNSHGSQVRWPLIGDYATFPGSKQINRSKRRKTGFPYLITSGVGCIDIQARINSPVEFVHITLLSDAKDSTNTPVQDSAAQPEAAPAESAQTEVPSDVPSAVEPVPGEEDLPVEPEQ